LPIVLILALFLVVLFSGCLTESQAVAKKSSSYVKNQSNQEVQNDLLKTVTHASVISQSANWDADTENDGLVIYPDLLDSNNETVEFEGINLTVDIEIWTLKMNNDFKEVKDRLVYSGTGEIDSWKDGNPFYSGGITIPYKDIKTVESDNSSGLLFVKIKLPDGRVMEAKEDFGVIIKAE